MWPLSQLTVFLQAPALPDPQERTQHTQKLLDSQKCGLSCGDRMLEGLQEGDTGHLTHPMGSRKVPSWPFPWWMRKEPQILQGIPENPGPLDLAPP